MNTECPILVGIFKGFSWIRCEGKGSFLNSPVMKDFGAERIAAGERCLVVDLGACSGMDSTFMGTLAGMAARLSAMEGGLIQIADAGARNRRSLEDLGLDFLMEIEPVEAAWLGTMDSIRAGLEPPHLAGPPGAPHAMHVLEAHQTLSDVNEKNKRTFAGVVTLLESELEEKQKSAGGAEGS